jgi:hypothetical protein
MASYGHRSRFHDGRVINTKARVITRKGVIALAAALKGKNDGNSPAESPSRDANIDVPGRIV